MAYSDNFPAQRPVFMADFANGGRIDPRATFTRASTANVWDGSKHLSSENLFTYSTPPNGWTLDSFTLTSGQTAPDGSTNAAKLTEDTSGSEHRIYPYSSVTTSGGSTTLSGYFKYIGRQWVMFRLNDGTNYRRVWFDIQNGALGSAETGITHSITASGNGYYKCVATIATSNTSYLPTIGGAPANTGITYTGSGADAFYVWGLQYNNNVGSVLSETSGQIHREYAPSLVSKANNVGRFDHTTDGQSMGILIEGQATNLYGNSLDMTGVAGTRTNIDSNVAVGPTGELTADALRLNGTDSNTHYREYSFTAAASTTYTFSVYLKAAGLSHAAIRSNNLFSTEYVYFNLSNGTVEGSPSMSNSMTAVGNGFYRCSVTATTTGSGAASFVIYITDSATSTIVATGDSYRAILGQAIQIESGSHPSSFIETSGGSTATRAVESLSVSVSDLGLTSGQDVSIITEANWGDPTDNPYNRFALALATDGNNRIAFYNNNGQNGSGWVRYSGSDSAFFNPGTTSGGYAKLGISAAMNSFNYAFNGTAGTEDTAGVVPEYSELEIGSNGIGTQQLDGHVKRVAVYGEALSDTNLQALTS